MKLYDVKIGETFKVAGVEFIKFTNEGDKVFAVAKDSLYNSRFGNDGNFAESDIKQRLETELLPKLEAEIGADNIFEFETDCTALDGTKPFSNTLSKVSLVSLDFYRQHREIFGKHNANCWWWLVTPDSDKYKDIVLCVAPSGVIDYYLNCYDYNGVRPILLFSASIFVSCD